MSLLTGIGYFFAVIILAFGLLSLVYGIPLIGLGIIIFGIIVIAIIRHFAKNERMSDDIHYMAKNQRIHNEELEDAENALAKDERILDDLERQKEKQYRN